MIKKVDIAKFGLFKNYLWDKTVGKDETFRKLNILYGRNYSGKTTLARLFKCIENNQIHPNYLDADFAITLYNYKIITQNNLNEFGTENKIRIYNTDFVKENLSWLHNDDGTIKPFTILGAKNIELDKKIKEIENKLGKPEERKGLLFELDEKNKDFEAKINITNEKRNDLDSKLRTKAQSIKNNATVFNVPTYQINTIKGDISSATELTILNEQQLEEKKKLLKEESKGNLTRLPEQKPNFASYYTLTEELLKQHIKPSEPIADLINDNLLQEWVRQGIDKHKGKKVTCGFCGNPLPKNLWAKLYAHFSKESEELRVKLQNQIETLEKSKQALENYLTLSKDNFYLSITSKFEDINKRWLVSSKAYSKSIDTLIAKVQEREKDIFQQKK